jgi:hypothetical protein
MKNELNVAADWRFARGQIDRICPRKRGFAPGQI